MIVLFSGTKGFNSSMVFYNLALQLFLINTTEVNDLTELSTESSSTSYEQ